MCDLLLQFLFYLILVSISFLNRFGSESIFWGRSIHWILKVSSILAAPWIY